MNNQVKKNNGLEVPVSVKASTAYVVCNVFQKSLSFITLPLFIRLLTTTEYGQYSIYSSWLSILTIFITLNLPYGSFSTAMMDFKDERDKYIASVQGISTVLGLVLLAIYWIFRDGLNEVLELPTFLVVFMIIEIISSCAFLCWMGKQRYEFKYKNVIVTTVIHALVSPVLALILIFMSDNKGYARILGYSLVTSGIGLFFYIKNLYKGKSLFNKKYWKYALSFNLPLLAYYFSQVIFNQSDRLMINHYCGTDKAGIYSVAYSLATILVFVLNAVNGSYVPWLYEKIKVGDQKENKKVSLIIAGIMALMLLCIIWMAPEIIQIMAGAEYAEAVWVIPPVTMSVLLLLYSQFSINVEFYYKQKFFLVIASIGSAASNIALNAIFIPKVGYVAAGYTTLFSYLLFAGMNYLCIHRHNRIGGKIEGVLNVKYLVIMLMLFLILGVVGIFLYDYLLIRIVIIVIAMIFMIANCKKGIKFLKTLKYR